MNWAIIVIYTLTVWLMLDIMCYYKNLPTLSSKVRDWTIRYPILPFIVGFIVGLVSGHWWWPLGSIPFGG